MSRQALAHTPVSRGTAVRGVVSTAAATIRISIIGIPGITCPEYGG
jgi:hypothetical protein